MPQEPTEPLVADDLAGRVREDLRYLAVGRRQRDVAHTLMTPLEVIMSGVGGKNVPQVGLAEDHEVVQAFAFYRADPSCAKTRSRFSRGRVWAGGY